MTVPADDEARLAGCGKSVDLAQADIERQGIFLRNPKFLAVFVQVGFGARAARHAPSSIPLRTGTVPVTRPSGEPAVTKRIARRM